VVAAAVAAGIVVPGIMISGCTACGGGTMLTFTVTVVRAVGGAAVRMAGAVMRAQIFAVVTDSIAICIHKVRAVGIFIVANAIAVGVDKIAVSIAVVAGAIAIGVNENAVAYRCGVICVPMGQMLRIGCACCRCTLCRRSSGACRKSSSAE